VKRVIQKLLIALMFLTGLRHAGAQGTAFTYQGRLNTNGVPASGSFDFEFALYNNAAGSGTAIGSAITQTGIGVTNGLFTTTLNFGPGVFTGNDLWLAISARSNGVGSYVALTPLQELNPAPYAIFSTTASNLSGTLPSGSLSGAYPDAVTLNNGANVFVGNGNGLTDLNAANLAGTLSDGVLPPDVALLDGANQVFTGTNTFAGAGHSFIVNTGPFSTNLFTGLSLQYYYSPGESAFQSSYNDGFASISFWTKQGAGFPIDRQVFIDRYGNVAIDQQDANNGVFNNGTTNGVGLSFGTTSGEGIASQRQPGLNQYGLDFYTAFNHRMSILNNGNVGIATTNPATALEVNGTATASAFSGPLLSMDGSDTNNGLAYIPNAGLPALNFGGSGVFLYGFDGGALGTVGPNEVSLAWNFLGNVWCSNNFSTLSLTIRGGSDLAEPFKITSSKEEVPDGSVVVIDKSNPGHLKVSSQPYDTRVAGVLSGANGVHPGIQMQQQGLLEGDRNVALTGRVYVQADISNGPIEPGDLLTTSSAPGRAMKVTDHLRAQGAILGKAMSGLSEGDGMVLVLVTLQ
jgi:hypothetical protein